MCRVGKVRREMCLVFLYVICEYILLDSIVMFGKCFSFVISFLIFDCGVILLVGLVGELRMRRWVLFVIRFNVLFVENVKLFFLWIGIGIGCVLVNLIIDW